MVSAAMLLWMASGVASAQITTSHVITEAETGAGTRYSVTMTVRAEVPADGRATWTLPHDAALAGVSLAEDARGVAYPRLEARQRFVAALDAGHQAVLVEPRADNDVIVHLAGMCGSTSVGLLVDVAAAGAPPLDRAASWLVAGSTPSGCAGPAARPVVELGELPYVDGRQPETRFCCSPVSTTLALAPTEVRGELPTSTVADRVRRHVNQLRFCYDQTLWRDPKLLAGEVTVGWMVGDDGVVRDAQVTSSTLANASVEACIVGRFGLIRFDPPDGPTPASITLQYRP